MTGGLIDIGKAVQNIQLYRWENTVLARIIYLNEHGQYGKIIYSYDIPTITFVQSSHLFTVFA